MSGQEEFILLKDIKYRRYFYIYGSTRDKMASESTSNPHLLLIRCHAIATCPQCAVERSVHNRIIFAYRPKKTFINPSKIRWVFSLKLMLPILLIGGNTSLYLSGIQEPVRTAGEFIFLIFWLMSNIFIHEVGHGAACIACGRCINKCGIKLNYFIPTAFIDTSDIRMASKREQIITSLAGVYGNAVAALLLIMISLSLQLTIGRAMLISSTFIFFNLLPIMKLDGYYVLLSALCNNIPIKVSDIVRKKLPSTQRIMIYIQIAVTVLFWLWLLFQICRYFSAGS